MLAIIIPYFKLMFFEANLKSLANQTDKRFKVYIGNDASPEDPEILLKQFEGCFDFEYKKFESNLGSISLTQQWERCIALSKDEKWLIILGDDDELGPNLVASFYKNSEAINNRGINLIRFASQLIDDSGKQLSDIYINPGIEKTTDAYFKKFQWESRSSLSEYIFRRVSFDAVGFTNFPLGWHSDDKAWLDFTNCGKMYGLNDAVVFIRKSKENISGKTDNLEHKNRATILFLKSIITNKKYTFNKFQKTEFLFHYGILIKQENQININNVVMGFYEFLKMGALYNGFRFLRRMFRARFLRK